MPRQRGLLREGLIMTDKNTGDETSYEDYLDELTNLVDEIGRDDCPVDQLEIKVRRAADLIRNLRKRLASTEATVQEVLKELENDRKVDQE